MLVFVVGTIGYRILGLGWLDAVYQTVTTITTVGFREVEEFADGEAVHDRVDRHRRSTVLYTFTLGVQVVVEGQVREIVGRRRMDKQDRQARATTSCCAAAGRVGRAIADDLARPGATSS